MRWEMNPRHNQALSGVVIAVTAIVFAWALYVFVSEGEKILRLRVLH